MKISACGRHNKYSGHICAIGLSQLLSRPNETLKIDKVSVIGRMVNKPFKNNDHTNWKNDLI